MDNEGNSSPELIVIGADGGATSFGNNGAPNSDAESATGPSPFRQPEEEQNLLVQLKKRGMKCGGAFHPWVSPAGTRVHFRVSVPIEIAINDGWRFHIALRGGNPEDEAERLHSLGRARYMDDGDYEVMLEVDPGTGNFKPVTIQGVGRVTFFSKSTRYNLRKFPRSACSV